MHLLNIDASPTQLRSLRKGRRVRIKHGTGINLIVHPATYHLVTRAFNKGKGAQVQLSREEIGANEEVAKSPSTIHDVASYTAEQTGHTPHIAGQGIFGNAFDRFLNKTGINKITDPLGKIAKPFVQTAIKGLVSKIPIVGNRLAEVASDYIDDPQKYQSKEGALNALKDVGLGTIQDKLGLGLYSGHGLGCGAGGMSGVQRGYDGRMHGMGDPSISEAASTAVWGKGLHTYGNRIRAGYGSAEALDHSAHLAHEHVMTREAKKAGTLHDSDPYAPHSRGYGLMGHGMHHQGSHSIVGRGGGMLEYCPPALVSQPYSANWQMGHFLPVQYQMFNQSMHSPHGHSMHGHGLY